MIEVEKLRSFARIRHDFVKSELVRLLAPNGWFDLHVINEKGKVSINENYPICLPYSGQYLKGIEFAFSSYAASETNGYLFRERWLKVNG